MGAVTGTFGATGQSASFTPKRDDPFDVSLWGTFVATVQLERSFDAGVTWLPVTYSDGSSRAWTGAVSTDLQETSDGVIFRLNCTSYTSGTVNYRISQ